MGGKFIAFEGIDGCGGETQSKLLTEFLESSGKKIIKIHYPDKNADTGKLFYKFLDKEIELNLSAQILIHATDRVKDKELIENHIKNNGIFIADRWIYSMFAFQGSQNTENYPIEKLVKLTEDFFIPKPDIVFYLKINPETSLKRKHQEHGKWDRHEENINFQKTVSNYYDMLAEKQVFGKWVIIDGEKTREEIFEEIKKILEI